MIMEKPPLRYDGKRKNKRKESPKRAPFTCIVPPLPAGKTLLPKVFSVAQIAEAAAAPAHKREQTLRRSTIYHGLPPDCWDLRAL
jgi:hypothetical protein